MFMNISQCSGWDWRVNELGEMSGQARCTLQRE